MTQIFENSFDSWKKNDLLTRIKNYEDNFFYNNKNELNGERNEILEQVYKGSKAIRNNFFNNYLSEITDNLNNHSDQNSYQYINFFRENPSKYNSYTYSKKLKRKEKYKEDNLNQENNNIIEICNMNIISTKEINNDKIIDKKNYEDENNENINENKELILYEKNLINEGKEANEQLENIQNFIEEDNINILEEKNNNNIFNENDFDFEKLNEFNDKEPNLNDVNEFEEFENNLSEKENNKNEETSNQKSKKNINNKSKSNNIKDILKEAKNYFQNRRKRFHKINKIIN